MFDKKYLEYLRNEPWRIALRKSLKSKERIIFARVKMRELDPQNRIKNFDEVNMGLSYKEALNEAKRCLDCIDPKCITGCPIAVNIPYFIKNIERNNIIEAANVLNSNSSLSAICGRICPQEKQCESRCIYLKINNQPVAIGYLERFVADFEQEKKLFLAKTLTKKNGIKVAVIGSGPAGLSFAEDMAKFGYKITVFEALHEIGGVLKYGIPKFRLPNKVVDAEIDFLKKIGVFFVKNIIIGKTISYKDLQNEGYQGFFVASGAGLPNFMHIPGENLSGILSANEYLVRVNLMGANMKKYDTPIFLNKKVAVIGGGNTAIDSIRIARRLGAEKAMLVYRRSEEEMPARIEEIKHAKEEGIQLMPLYTPIRYIGNKNGHVKQIILQKMKLGDLDNSGRKKSIKICGVTEILEVDIVIVAIGVSPNPTIPNSFKGLRISKFGSIIVNQKTLQTNLSDVYAGGDIVRGSATVILAMEDGKRAAASMHQLLLQSKNL